MWLDVGAKFTWPNKCLLTIRFIPFAIIKLLSTIYVVQWIPSRNMNVGQITIPTKKILLILHPATLKWILNRANKWPQTIFTTCQTMEEFKYWTLFQDAVTLDDFNNHILLDSSWSKKISLGISDLFSSRAIMPF